MWLPEQRLLHLETQLPGTPATSDPSRTFLQGGGSGSEQTSPVLYSHLRAGQDRKRTPHCIRSSGTQCDLSSSLTDLLACYTAEVLSEPPIGVLAEGLESPHQRSPRFCPYNDSRCMQLTPGPTSTRSPRLTNGPRLTDTCRDVCKSKTRPASQDSAPQTCSPAKTKKKTKKTIIA